MIEIIVEVNGEKVQLSDFPREIITNILLGMLQSLKGVNEIKEAVIRLREN